jgi:site-specific DNA recombinase
MSKIPNFSSPEGISPEQIFSSITELAKPTSDSSQKRAVLYTRKSKYINGEIYYSPEIQGKETRARAESMECKIVADISDLDKTGRTSDRPGLQKIIQMVKSKEVDFIIVQYLDRGYRNGLSTLKFFELLTKYGVNIISVHENIDTRTFAGRFFLYILAIISELPVWTASERSRQAQAERRKKGYHNGGYRLGYCNGLCSICTDPNGKGYCPQFGDPDRPESQRGKIQVFHPIEKFAIYMMADLYSQGYSSRYVSLHLNANEFKLPDGSTVKFRTKGVPGSRPPGKFTPEAVQDIIKNPFYAGQVFRKPTLPLSFDDDIENPKSVKKTVKNRDTPIKYYKGLHEPLISNELWEKNCQIRAANTKKPLSLKERKNEFLLSGVALCLECSTREGKPVRLRGTTNSSGKRVYRCPNAYGWKSSKIADAVMPKNIVAIPDTKTPSAVKSHVKFELPAELLEDQALNLVNKFKIPEEWMDLILAYFQSDDGTAEFKRKKYNLIQEAQKQKDLFSMGSIQLVEAEEKILRIHNEISTLSPRAEKQSAELIPHLKDFQNMWKDILPYQQNSLLKVMFRGIYFNSKGEMKNASAYDPFRSLLNLPTLLQSLNFPGA